MTRASLTQLTQMKRDGRKIVAVVLYDSQLARIADAAGVDVISAGDSVGTAMWGHADESEVTIEQMILVCRAVRRGATRALVSCDVPLRSLQSGSGMAVADAARLIRDGGADILKVDAAAASTDGVRAIARTGIPVWAQFGTAMETDAVAVDRLVKTARELEAAGAALLDFRHSGPRAGAAVAASVTIPVLGGLGGGPWLDGRVRSLAAALGYLASAVDDLKPRYANLAATSRDAIGALCDDVRAARPLRGE